MVPLPFSYSCKFWIVSEPADQNRRWLNIVTVHSELGLCRCNKMHRKDYIFSQNRFIAHCLPHLWPLLHILAISSKISSFYKEKVPDILIAAHVNSFVYRDIWVEKRTMAYLMKTLFVPYGLCHSWFWNSELVFLGSVIQISSEGRHTVCQDEIFKIKTQEEYLQTQQDHLINTSK